MKDNPSGCCATIRAPHSKKQGGQCHRKFYSPGLKIHFRCTLSTRRSEPREGETSVLVEYAHRCDIASSALWWSNVEGEHEEYCMGS